MKKKIISGTGPVHDYTHTRLTGVGAARYGDGRTRTYLLGRRYARDDNGNWFE